MPGIKTSYNLSARFRKHYCHECNTKLQVRKISTVVNSKSEEAKDFDFNFYGSHGGKMVGDIKFSEDVFFCENCGTEISIKEHRAYEMEEKGGIKYPWTILFIGIALFLIGLFFVIIGNNMRTEFYRTRKYGIQTEAIVSRSRANDGQRIFYIQFTHDSQEFEFRSRFSRVSVGDIRTIYFLPDNPSRFRDTASESDDYFDIAVGGVMVLVSAGIIIVFTVKVAKIKTQIKKHSLPQ